jgi:hypothetical protein
VFLCNSIAQDFLQIGDVKIDVLKQPIIPEERCRLGNGWYSLEKSGGKLLEVSELLLNMSKFPYCQGIWWIRIGIPGNSANVRRGILRYSPEYFRNSDFCPLVTRDYKIARNP